MAGRGAERRLATPPGPAFSRAAADHWALAAPARLLGCAKLQPNSASSASSTSSSSAPARFQPSSSPVPAQLRFVSATPLCEPHEPWFPAVCPSVARCPATSRPPNPRDPLFYPHNLATPLRPFSLALSLSVCLSASPPAFSFLSPASPACFLGRCCGAASQENPRNLCKKLTMKFKKLYDFGAIFEWRGDLGSKKNEGGRGLFGPPSPHPHYDSGH